jgi:hypothetical protein
LAPQSPLSSLTQTLLKLMIWCPGSLVCFSDDSLQNNPGTVPFK